VSSNNRCIPLYAPDGTSLGKREVAAAERLVERGFVKPSYGRKGHLKAIWLRREDGSNPVQVQAKAGTRYSFIERLEHGRCWTLRSLDYRDEDGFPVATIGPFLQVVADCSVSAPSRQQPDRTGHTHAIGRA
jgi:hypothetical protein